MKGLTFKNFFKEFEYYSIGHQLHINFIPITNRKYMTGEAGSPWLLDKDCNKREMRKFGGGGRCRRC